MFDYIPCSVKSKREKNGITIYRTDNEKLKYVVFDGEYYSHGNTLKEAKDDLIYKNSNRDTTPYEYWRQETGKIKTSELIQGYRAITGACQTGTKYFISSLSKKKKAYTIKELIILTKNQYGNELFVKFLKN
ncbi:MAG: hypothetical protein EHM12_08110 [Dehalococcoidia bacterium]|nr:MAG: hypothetical protein EHM12_08110 [Dehalococcoidia bacterium]